MAIGLNKFKLPTGLAPISGLYDVGLKRNIGLNFNIDYVMKKNADARKNAYKARTTHSSAFDPMFNKMAKEELSKGTFYEDWDDKWYTKGFYNTAAKWHGWGDILWRNTSGYFKKGQAGQTFMSNVKVFGDTMDAIANLLKVPVTSLVESRPELGRVLGQHLITGAKAGAGLAGGLFSRDTFSKEEGMRVFQSYADLFKAETWKKDKAKEFNILEGYSDAYGLGETGRHEFGADRIREGMQIDTGNKWGNLAVDMAFEVVLDPMNWVSFGTYTLGKTALKEGSEIGIKVLAGEMAGLGADDFAKIIAGQTDTLTKAGAKKVAGATKRIRRGILAGDRTKFMDDMLKYNPKFYNNNGAARIGGIFDSAQKGMKYGKAIQMGNTMQNLESKLANAAWKLTPLGWGYEGLKAGYKAAGVKGFAKVFQEDTIKPFTQKFDDVGKDTGFEDYNKFTDNELLEEVDRLEDLVRDEELMAGLDAERRAKIFEKRDLVDTVVNIRNNEEAIKTMDSEIDMLKAIRQGKQGVIEKNPLYKQNQDNLKQLDELTQRRNTLKNSIVQQRHRINRLRRSQVSKKQKQTLDEAKLYLKELQDDFTKVIEEQRVIANDTNVFASNFNKTADEMNEQIDALKKLKKNSDTKGLRKDVERVNRIFAKGKHKKLFADLKNITVLEKKLEQLQKKLRWSDSKRLKIKEKEMISKLRGPQAMKRMAEALPHNAKLNKIIRQFDVNDEILNSVRDTIRNLDNKKVQALHNQGGLKGMEADMAAVSKLDKGVTIDEVQNIPKYRQELNRLNKLIKSQTDNDALIKSKEALEQKISGLRSLRNLALQIKENPAVMKASMSRTSMDMDPKGILRSIGAFDEVPGRPIGGKLKRYGDYNEKAIYDDVRVVQDMFDAGGAEAIAKDLDNIDNLEKQLNSIQEQIIKNNKNSLHKEHSDLLEKIDGLKALERLQETLPYNPAAVELISKLDKNGVVMEALGEDAANTINDMTKHFNEVAGVATLRQHKQMALTLRKKAGKMSVTQQKLLTELFMEYSAKSFDELLVNITKKITKAESAPTVKTAKTALGITVQDDVALEKIYSGYMKKLRDDLTRLGVYDKGYLESRGLDTLDMKTLPDEILGTDPNIAKYSSIIREEMQSTFDRAQLSRKQLEGDGFIGDGSFKRAFDIIDMHQDPALTDMNNMWSEAMAKNYEVETVSEFGGKKLTAHQLKQKIEDGQYVTYDLETTSGDTSRGQVVQLAGRRFKINKETGEEELIKEFNDYIQLNPGETLDDVFHIINKDAQGKIINSRKGEKQSLVNFLDWIEKDDILIAHNGKGFDSEFLKRAAKDYEIEGYKDLANPTIESVNLFKTIWAKHQKDGTLGNFKQGTLLDYWKNASDATPAKGTKMGTEGSGPIAGLHDASVDVKYLADLFARSLRDIKEGGDVNTLADLNHIGKVKGMETERILKHGQTKEMLDDIGSGKFTKEERIKEFISQSELDARRRFLDENADRLDDMTLSDNESRDYIEEVLKARGALPLAGKEVTRIKKQMRGIEASLKEVTDTKARRALKKEFDKLDEQLKNAIELEDRIPPTGKEVKSKAEQEVAQLRNKITELEDTINKVVNMNDDEILKTTQSELDFLRQTIKQERATKGKVTMNFEEAQKQLPILEDEMFNMNWLRLLSDQVTRNDLKRLPKRYRSSLPGGGSDDAIDAMSDEALRRTRAWLRGNTFRKEIDKVKLDHTVASNRVSANPNFLQDFKGTLRGEARDDMIARRDVDIESANLKEAGIKPKQRKAQTARRQKLEDIVRDEAERMLIKTNKKQIRSYVREILQKNKAKFEYKPQKNAKELEYEIKTVYGHVQKGLEAVEDLDYDDTAKLVDVVEDLDELLDRIQSTINTIDEYTPDGKSVVIDNVVHNADPQAWYNTVSDVRDKLDDLLNYEDSITRDVHESLYGKGYGHIQLSKLKKYKMVMENLDKDENLYSLYNIIKGTTQIQDQSMLKDGYSDLDKVLADAFGQDSTQSIPGVKNIINEIESAYKASEMQKRLWIKIAQKYPDPAVTSKAYQYMSTIDREYKRLWRKGMKGDELLEAVEKKITGQINKRYYDKLSPDIMADIRSMVSEMVDRDSRTFMAAPDKDFINSIRNQLKDVMLDNTYNVNLKGASDMATVSARTGGAVEGTMDVDTLSKTLYDKITDMSRSMREPLREIKKQNKRMKRHKVNLGWVQKRYKQYPSKLIDLGGEYSFNFDEWTKADMKKKRAVFDIVEGLTSDMEDVLPFWVESKNSSLYKGIQGIADYADTTAEDISQSISKFKKKTDLRNMKVGEFDSLVRSGNFPMLNEIEDWFMKNFTQMEGQTVNYVKDTGELLQRIKAGVMDHLESAKPPKWEDAVNKADASGTFTYKKARTQQNILKDIHESLNDGYTTIRNSFTNPQDFLDFTKRNPDVNVYVLSESTKKGSQSGLRYNRIHLRNLKDVEKLDGIDPRYIAVGDKFMQRELDKMTKYKPKLSNKADFVRRNVMLPLKALSISNLGFILNNAIDIPLKNQFAQEGGAFSAGVAGKNVTAAKMQKKYMDKWKEAMEYLDFDDYGHSLDYKWIDEMSERFPGFFGEGEEAMVRTVDDLYSVGGNEMQDMLKHVAKGDVIGKKKTSTAYEKIINKIFYGSKWSPIAGNLKISSWMENNGRLALYLDSVEKGLTKNESLNKVLKTHFSYGNKSSGEMRAEFVWPFLSFLLRGTEFWMDMLHDPKAAKLVTDYLEHQWGDTDSGDYDAYQASRGNLLLGSQVLQTGMTASEALLATGDPTGVLARKTNPLIKAGVGAFMGAPKKFSEGTALSQKFRGFNRDSWEFLPGISNYKTLSHAAKSVVGKEPTRTDLFPSLYQDYQTSGRYYNRYAQQHYRKRHSYKNLYTRTGVSRLELSALPTTPDNLNYKLQDIYWMNR